MKFARFPILAVILFALSRFASKAEVVRETPSLDHGWRFHLGDIPMPVIKAHDPCYNNSNAGKALCAAAPEYDATDWRELDLPHDWAVE